MTIGGVLLTGWAGGLMITLLAGSAGIKNSAIFGIFSMLAIDLIVWGMVR